MGVLKYFFISLVFCGSLWAMPALDRAFVLNQPDGSSLRVRSVGNEVFNFKVTADGYVVARDSLGFFSYLGEDGSNSGVHAHESENRTAQELEFLSSLNKDAVLNLLNQQKTARTYESIHKAEGSFESVDSNTPSPRYMPKAKGVLNSGEAKALVILVQFSDIKFSSSDPKSQFEKYLNAEGYSDNGNIGSVRDYFKDNSSGKFIPNFDVVGPITLSGSAYKTYGEHSRYAQAGAAVALMEALDTLVNRKTIDFTQYDSDKDGYVDFVHMIYAGLGSNDSGQDSAIWPHMWYLSLANYQLTWRSSAGKAVASSGSGFRKTYTYVDKYACSNELDGALWYDYKQKQTVGVGTFVHEFSHVMGLGDHYATDGSSVFTATYWDVMDAGAYNYASQGAGMATAPPYYSAFEKEYLGWSKPDQIVEGDGLELLPVQENKAVKVVNPKNTDEFYVLEYRNRSKWDVGLPNHGMLIWHIDYDSLTWYNAKVNTSERLHVDVVEADGVADEWTVTADVFPGTSWSKRYNSFNKFVTWDGSDLDVSLSNITEANDYSKVTFNVKFGDSYEGPIVSSSSEEIEVASSSSQEPVIIESSSSEIVVVEPVVQSSSSEQVLESSSSEVIAEVGSSDSALPVRNGVRAGVKISRANGVLTISGLPQGNKVLRVFSLNGNLLMSQPVTGGTITLDKARTFGNIPVVVKVDSFVQMRF
ncbi:M6 family metalloprotease domain-containing protein [Fibrobacter sp. UWEL]|uniref:M6 family metalloprotease domain-containing protein n=1 Tax=Fibrobacter sp. UWEL TaxID=1896209 RepID=UPI000914EB88|nr:M6 family metalloprotease domain-containing protein [Fibrobacter sp. UWEL]SHK99222.1 M6 family metalloprotease domain-containing protein [Fibrobacter sp. UWEL]